MRFSFLSNTFPFKFGLMLFLISFSSLTSHSQSLRRQVIGSTGSSTLVGSYFIRQTTGQPSNANVFDGFSITLRQGFQQPLIFKDRAASECRLQAYPNPAFNVVSVLPDDLETPFEIFVYDLSGKKAFEFGQGSYQNVRLPALPASIYLLHVQYVNGRSCVQKIYIGHE